MTKKSVRKGNGVAKFKVLDDDCALCKLMESGDGGDMAKLKKGFAEMAMRANMDPKSGITVGMFPNNKFK